MIINIDREPKYSLYYIGGIVLEVLYSSDNIPIDELYQKVKNFIDNNLYVDFVYYSLDWLYILSLIEVEEDRVKLC